VGTHAKFAATVCLFVGFSASAADWTQTRELNERIKLATSGKVEVLNKKLNEDIFPNQEDVAKLNQILTAIAADANLAWKSAGQVGQEIASLLVNREENVYGENRFCKLALEPINLFSSSVAAQTCRAQTQEASSLLNP
jgi:uncharacterized protein YacL (UPF0231 family)